MANHHGGPKIRPHRPIFSTVPAGCLVLFGAVILFFGALLVFSLSWVAPGYRSTDTYKEAMALVNESPQAREALGSPIRETGLVSYITETSDKEYLRLDRDLKRRLSLRVGGMDASATLYVEGIETDEGVRVKAARLTLSTGEVIQLTP